MSDLTTFRNWCRRQAAADEIHPHRALWVLLADEVDAYMAGELNLEPTPDDVPLEGM